MDLALLLHRFYMRGVLNVEDIKTMLCISFFSSA